MLPVVGCSLLVVLLRIVAASTTENKDGIEGCLEGKRMEVCLEELASNELERASAVERLELGPGLQLVRTNRTARGMADLASRTISMDLVKVAEGLTKGAGELWVPADGRSSRRRRRLMMILILTALIAAKAAAIATSTSIMVPLALKGITVLAMKALVIGKIAVVVASAFGFLRLISGSTEHTTEVIYDPQPSHHHHHQKRVDHKKWMEQREPLHFSAPSYSLLQKEPQPSYTVHHREPTASSTYSVQHKEPVMSSYSVQHKEPLVSTYSVQHKEPVMTSYSVQHKEPGATSYSMFRREPQSSVVKHREPSSYSDQYSGSEGAGDEGLQHFRLPQLSLQTLPPPIAVRKPGKSTTRQ